MMSAQRVESSRLFLQALSAPSNSHAEWTEVYRGVLAFVGYGSFVDYGSKRGPRHEYFCLSGLVCCKKLRMDGSLASTLIGHHLNMARRIRDWFRNPISTSDADFALAAVTVDGKRLMHTSDALKATREIVLAAVKQHGVSLGFASTELKADRALVLAAVRERGTALNFASEDLKADPEVVLASFQRNLEHMSAVLKGGGGQIFLRTDIMYLCNSAWSEIIDFEEALGLECMPAELQADREVMLAAVRERGSALKFASEELKADREVVLAAVQERGSALLFASEELKADREVVLASFQRNLDFMSAVLKGGGGGQIFHHTDIMSLCNASLSLIIDFEENNDEEY